MSAARAVRHAPLELGGRRVLLRSLTEDDFPAWHEVRTRCADWLLRWEPRPKGAPGSVGGPPQLRGTLWHQGARAPSRNRLRLRNLRG